MDATQAVSGKNIVGNPASRLDAAKNLGITAALGMVAGKAEKLVSTLAGDLVKGVAKLLGKECSTVGNLEKTALQTGLKDSVQTAGSANEVVNAQRAGNYADKRPWVEADTKTLKVITADSQIPGSLKKSDSYHSELGGLTRNELQTIKDGGGDQSAAAGQMLKLMKDKERLLDKIK